MNNETLMAITANMPMRVIEVGGKPYLERYFAGMADDGGQWWYHRFVRSDSERHLHSHPWEGRALILTGWYKEQVRPLTSPNDGSQDRFIYHRLGGFNLIFPETQHRIVEVQPNTWTLLHVKPERKPQWYFIDDNGQKQYMNTSPVDWWKNCKARE